MATIHSVSHGHASESRPARDSNTVTQNVSGQHHVESLAATAQALDLALTDIEGPVATSWLRR